MKNLWSQITGLFKTVEESSSSNPVIHELIERGAEELALYEGWKCSLVCRRLTEWLWHQYGIWQALPGEVDETIDFLDTPSCKGFAVHFHKTNYSRRDARHLFDYLKERVLTLPYRCQISDTRTYSQKDWVETVERHYLKPKPGFAEPSKLNQRFGNVTIELTLRNDAVHNLKFRATSYNDHLYASAEDFKDLMQAVLE
ncbi:MAG: hypothetical protein EPO28_18805 [Saprospiraceae bacterium]|nr:MAG: hypothetical protein EPO28_18805 [Saprospiraceae bacterium]